MATTTNLALRYPILSNSPNVPQDMQNLATDVDTVVFAYMPLWCRKTTDTSRASNTTASADPDLLVTLPASTNYWVHGVIVYAADTTADLKAGLYGPSGANFYGTFRGPNSGVSTNPATLLLDPPGINTTPATAGYVIGGIGSGSTLTIEVAGLLTMATGGTVGWAWAQNVSSGTATVVKAGSALVFNKLP